MNVCIHEEALDVFNYTQNASFVIIIIMKYFFSSHE